MKTHLSFTTTDLAKSVEFYSTLLNAKPEKVLADYTLFVTNQPGLELALSTVATVPQLGDDHFGIFVETTEEVERAIDRLTDAGLTALVEREEICCYASQTKVWATDPMGRRWEIYTVHEETEARDSSGSCCAT